MKISKKELRKLVESSLSEAGLLQTIFGSLDDRPGFETDQEVYARMAAAEDYEDDYDDMDFDFGESDEKKEDDEEEVLSEIDAKGDGVDLSLKLDDGSYFHGDIEPLSPEKAFSLGYELSADTGPIGVNALDSYPNKSTSKSGRMFDYGHSKSDSHEGRMTKAKLFRMGQMAQSLESQILDGDDLPGWVQDKVTTAEDRLRSAYDYMTYKIRRLQKGGNKLTESNVRELVRSGLIELMKS